MQITSVADSDLDDLLALNEAAVPHVNSIDLRQMKWFADNAEHFRVARIDGGLAGFLIGLRPGHGYASLNYRWFCERRKDFGYVDRVIVAAGARRRGVASQLYDDFAEFLRGHVPIMTCEVNIRPPNESSMTFHERRGFVRLGTQETDGGVKEVALLEKRL